MIFTFINTDWNTTRNERFLYYFRRNIPWFLHPLQTKRFARSMNVTSRSISRFPSCHPLVLPGFGLFLLRFGDWSKLVGPPGMMLKSVLVCVSTAFLKVDSKWHIHTSHTKSRCPKLSGPLPCLTSLWSATCSSRHYYGMPQSLQKISANKKIGLTPWTPIKASIVSTKWNCIAHTNIPPVVIPSII